MLGIVVNRSRDMTRQIGTYIAPAQPALALEMALYVKAFSKTLINHLRDDIDLQAELTSIGMSTSEAQTIMSAQHRPNMVLKLLSDMLAEADANSAERQIIDTNLTMLADMLGGCERILRTPVPIFYTHHIARSMTIYLAMLPFGLVDAMGFDTIPAMGVITFLLCGIDEIGLQIEEPFGILPLETLSDRIQLYVTNATKTATTTASGTEHVALV